MDTYFATPDRSSEDELKNEIAFISNNSVIDGLLHSVSGLLAVLNSQRQILAVNSMLLEMLQIDDVETVLGLRPGEALKCVHADEMPAGCGTSKYCSTCGAAISIVTSLTSDIPAEKECAITTKENSNRDLFFRVRCVPIQYEQKRLLLLFLQDITYQQRLTALERVFFHDINGIITGFQGACHLLSKSTDMDEIRDLSRTIQTCSLRLMSEISVQQCLSNTGAAAYQPIYTVISVTQVFHELRALFRNHAVSKNKSLVLPKDDVNIALNTEPSLLLKILTNMIINAFEETTEGDEVRVWCEPSEDKIIFSVWNRKSIPPDIARRIFQRNFSTKAKIGRGLGTFSMKLFGEDILGGALDFTTSEKEGTVFRFSVKK